MTSLTLLNDQTFTDLTSDSIYVDTIYPNNNASTNFSVAPQIAGTNLNQYVRNQLSATGGMLYNNTTGLMTGIEVDNYNRDITLTLNNTNVLSADLNSGSGQSLILYMNYSQSVGSNKALAITPTNTTQTILSTNIAGNTTQLLTTFEILQSTLNQTFIPSGIFDINLFTSEDSANDGLQVYADVIIWDGSTETIIATTDIIEVIQVYPNVGETSLSAVNTIQRAFTTGYSLRIKIYGVNDRGSSHTVYTYYEGSGSSYSHVHTPFNSTLVFGYSGTAPISVNNTTQVISISQAGPSADGYVSSTDWNTFNNKENVLTFNAPLSRATNTISIPNVGPSADGYLSSTQYNSILSNSSLWSQTGTYIYRNTGNVVIGSSTGGTERLTVYGNEDVGDITNGNYLRISGTNPSVPPFISNTLLSFYSKGVPPTSSAFVDARIFSSGGNNTSTFQGTLTSRAKVIEVRDETNALRSSINATGCILYGATGTVFINVGPTGINIGGSMPTLNGSTITTTNIPEGTNQYFTTARARTAIGATGAISYNSTTGIISGGYTGNSPISVNNTTGVISMPNVNDTGTDGYLTSAQYDALAEASVLWTNDTGNTLLRPTTNAYNIQTLNTDLSATPTTRDVGNRWRRTTLSGTLDHYLRMRTGGVKDGYLIHENTNSTPLQLCAGASQPAVLIGGNTATDTIDANTCLQIEQAQTATPTLVKIENNAPSNALAVSRLWLKDATASYSIQSGGNADELDIVNTATSTALMTLTPTILTHFGTKTNLASNSVRSIEIDCGTTSQANIDFHSVNSGTDFDGRIQCSGGSAGATGSGAMNYIGTTHNFNTTVNITGQCNATNTASFVNAITNTRSQIDANSAVFEFYKSRNGLTTNSGDYLGGISAYGRNTSNANSRGGYWDCQQSAAAGTTVSARMMFGVRNLAGTEQEIVRYENGKASFRTTSTALDGDVIMQKSSSGGTHALSLYNDNTTSTTNKYTGFNTYNRQVSTDYETGSFKVYPTDNGINNAKINLDLRLNSSIQTFMELNSLGNSYLYGSTSATTRYEMARWYGNTTILNKASTANWETSSIYINGNTTASENGLRFHPNSNGNFYQDFRGTGQFIWRGDNTSGATQRGSLNFTNGTWSFGNATPAQVLNDGQVSVPNMNGSATDPLVRRNPGNGILTIDISDKRIKNNLRLLPDEYWKNKVMELQPQMFDLHPLVDNGKTDVVGFIAQDIQQFDPNLIGIVPRVMNKCKHCQTHCVNHPEGECECPDECTCLELTDALTINSAGVIPYLAGALKVVVKENEQLKMETSQLKDKIKQLEDENENNNEMIEDMKTDIEELKEMVSRLSSIFTLGSNMVSPPQTPRRTRKTPRFTDNELQKVKEQLTERINQQEKPSTPLKPNTPTRQTFISM